MSDKMFVPTITKLRTGIDPLVRTGAWSRCACRINRIATTARDLNDLLANLDHKALDAAVRNDNPTRIRRTQDHPGLSWGTRPDLASLSLKQELPIEQATVDVEGVVDVLRDRQDLQFKRDSEAHEWASGQGRPIGWSVLKPSTPMNLLQKLSMQGRKSLTAASRR